MKAKRARPAPAPAFDPDAAARPGSGLFGLPHRPADARVVVIPVPMDATTSYRPGTARAPRAVLEASRQVDLWDREYGAVYEGGIAMVSVPARLTALNTRARRAAVPVIAAGGARRGDARHRRALDLVDDAGARVNAWVKARAREALDRGQIPVVLGGDHASPFGLVDELGERHGSLGILHVDAHHDLREAYEGFRWSHASIFWNVLAGIPSVSKLVQVGIRDFGHAEMRMVEESAGRVEAFYEADLRDSLARGETWDAACHRIVATLPDTVYVSFDIDGLSPDLCPHTGTPVPGGLGFSEACHLLRTLALSGKRVVGADLCEVVPGPRGDEWDASVGARLLYKIIGCATTSQR
jgi:agmatinase